jgi:hypothetical protein
MTASVRIRTQQQDSRMTGSLERAAAVGSGHDD